MHDYLRPLGELLHLRLVYYFLRLFLPLSW